MKGINLNINALALIMSTLFFVYVHFGWGYSIKNEIELPLIDKDGTIFFKALALWLIAWGNLARFIFVGTKWIKPVTICFHITISYAFSELFNTAQGHFSVFGFCVFCFMLVFLIVLILRREKLKWSEKLRQHKYLYLFCAWMLTF